MNNKNWKKKEPTVAHKGHETPDIYFGKFEW